MKEFVIQATQFDGVLIPEPIEQHCANSLTRQLCPLLRASNVGCAKASEHKAPKATREERNCIFELVEYSDCRIKDDVGISDSRALYI